jgi:hypothetical protein
LKRLKLNANKGRLKAMIENRHPAAKEMPAAFTDFAHAVLQGMTAGDEPQLANRDLESTEAKRRWHGGDAATPEARQPS